MCKTRLACFVICTVLFGAVLPATADTLAVIPFTSHAQTDISYLENGMADMLSSRIAVGAQVTVIDTARVRARIAKAPKPVDRAIAVTIGQDVNADYVLWGSITQIGSGFSLDAEIVPVSGKTKPVAVYEQAASLNDIMPAINALAAKITAQAFASPAPSPAATATQTPPGQAHPEKLLADAAGIPKATPIPAPVGTASASPVAAGQTSPFIVAQPIVGRPSISAKNEAGFFKSDDMAEVVVGLAAADLDGDNTVETIVLTEQSLLVKTIKDGAFTALAQHQAARHEKYLAVDAADTDGDGRAEIFLTCITPHSRKLCSQVMELQSGRLTPIIEDQNWYFRAMDTTTIWGQKKGISDLFLPGLWRLEKKGADLVQAEVVALPNQTACVFDVAQGDICNNGKKQWLISDSRDQLSLYNDAGEPIWESEIALGGSETYLTAEGNGAQMSDRRYLSQRLYIGDINRDGRTEVVTVANQSKSASWFKRYRQYGRTAIVGLAWDGLGLSERWRTREISGYAADFAIADMDNDGHLEIAAAIVSARDGLMSEPRSCVIVYDLEAAPQ